MLIEAMVAMLIFSLGILGIVGMQAGMISNAAEAKYRSEAGLYANRLLGEMAAANRATASDLNTFSSGASYTAWFNAIKNGNASTGLLGLPGAASNPPTVAIASVNNVTGQPTRHDVTINVFWQAPGQPLHKHVVTASISAD